MLLPLLFITLVWIAFMVMMELATKGKASLYMLMIYCILYFLPTAYLHVTYYIKNRETEVQLIASGITISSDGQRTGYH